MAPERRDRMLALTGGVAAVAALAMIALSPRAALTGWLGAAVLLQSLPAGALLLLMTMRLIAGAWRDELEHVCEAGALLVPLAALAFVPVLLGMAAIYDWQSAPASSEFQAVWLGYGPFALRTLLWFALLAAIGWVHVGRGGSKGTASAGLIALILLGSLVAVDWLMSLDLQFHSSGFGLQLLSIELAAAYAALLLLRLALGPPPERARLLGGLFLTLMLLWAYFQYMPYFIIWSGNLPDGVAWYAARSGGWWSAAIWTAAALGGVPILALLFPAVRTNPRWLGRLAAITLAGKAIEIAWFALPSRGPLAVVAFALAVLGLCLLGLAWLLAGRRRLLDRTGREAAA